MAPAPGASKASPDCCNGRLSLSLSSVAVMAADLGLALLLGPGRPQRQLAPSIALDLHPGQPGE